MLRTVTALLLQQGTQGPKQKRQQQQQQQREQLQQVAVALLDLWLPAQQLWLQYSSSNTDQRAELKVMQPAVELAAALAQTALQRCFRWLPRSLTGTG
jgi:hypothetical protein